MRLEVSAHPLDSALDRRCACACAAAKSRCFPTPIPTADLRVIGPRLWLRCWPVPSRLGLFSRSARGHAQGFANPGGQCRGADSAIHPSSAVGKVTRTIPGSRAHHGPSPAPPSGLRGAATSNSRRFFHPFPRRQRGRCSSGSHSLPRDSWEAPEGLTSVPAAPYTWLRVTLSHLKLRGPGVF